MIAQALDAGADINKIFSLVYIGMYTLDNIKDLILNHSASYLTADKFLGAIITAHNYDGVSYSKQEVVSKKIELIKQAIALGADVNTLIIGNHFQYTPLEKAEDEEIIQILQEHGAKCSELKILEVEFQLANAFERIWNYNRESSDIIAKNLAAPRIEVNKIPYNFFQIWFTYSSKPREMLETDIELVIQNHQILEQDNISWNHVVWTNDKSLIPNSVSLLAENGVQVREIKEIQNDLRLFEEIAELIDEQMWGVASDTARYNLIYKFGGVYADMNFQLYRSPEDELYRYDFFSMGINNFFAAKPEHPITSSLLDMVEKNLVDPPLYIEKAMTSYYKTVLISYRPFAYAYAKSSNKDGNIDMDYSEIGITPYGYDEDDDQVESNKETNHPCDFSQEFQQFVKFGSHPDICGSKDLLIGQDNVGSDSTWDN